MYDIDQRFVQQGLVRPREGRALGGVCAGLGRRFGIAPWPARVLFVLLLMLIPGSQILIYPVPVDPDAVGADGSGPAAVRPDRGPRSLTVPARGTRSGGAVLSTPPERAS